MLQTFMISQSRTCIVLAIRSRQDGTLLAVFAHHLVSNRPRYRAQQLFVTARSRAFAAESPIRLRKNRTHEQHRYFWRVYFRLKPPLLTERFDVTGCWSCTHRRDPERLNVFTTSPAFDHACMHVQSRFGAGPSLRTHIGVRCRPQRACR